MVRRRPLPQTAVREFVDKEISPCRRTGAATWSRIRSSGSCSPPSGSARWRLNRSQTVGTHARDRGANSTRTEVRRHCSGDGGLAEWVSWWSAEPCRVSMGLVTGMGVSLGLVPTIASRGTLCPVENWLPGLVTYDKIRRLGHTETRLRSDAFGGMKSHVVRDGDDYILNGRRRSSQQTRRRHRGGLRQKLDEGDAPSTNETAKVLTFVLDRGMEGFARSKPFRKMGIHSSRTGELFFSNVRLDATDCST